MDKGSYVAVSGSLGQERMMDIISNNLANVNTAGFKADRLLFESYLKKSMSPEHALQTPEQMQSGAIATGNRDNEFLVATKGFTDFAQGAVRDTGQPMDFALDGDGFFSVLTPEGERFTRGGSMVVDSEGRLSTRDGNPLLDIDNQPIYLGNNSFNTDTQGNLTDMDNNPIAALKVVNFANKEQLEKMGDGLYKAKDQAAGSWGEAKVLQGYLESSNINPVAEMTRMITTLRSYQTFQKAIQSEDEMTSRLITDVGR